MTIKLKAPTRPSTSSPSLTVPSTSPSTSNPCPIVPSRIVPPRPLYKSTFQVPLLETSSSSYPPHHLSRPLYQNPTTTSTKSKIDKTEIPLHLITLPHGNSTQPDLSSCQRSSSHPHQSTRSNPSILPCEAQLKVPSSSRPNLAKLDNLGEHSGTLRRPQLHNSALKPIIIHMVHRPKISLLPRHAFELPLQFMLHPSGRTNLPIQLTPDGPVNRPQNFRFGHVIPQKTPERTRNHDLRLPRRFSGSITIIRKSSSGYPSHPRRICSSGFYSLEGKMSLDSDKIPQTSRDDNRPPNDVLPHSLRQENRYCQPRLHLGEETCFEDPDSRKTGWKTSKHQQSLLARQAFRLVSHPRNGSIPRTNRLFSPHLDFSGGSKRLTPSTQNNQPALFQGFQLRPFTISYRDPDGRIPRRIRRSNLPNLPQILKEPPSYYLFSRPLAIRSPIHDSHTRTNNNIESHSTHSTTNTSNPTPYHMRQYQFSHIPIERRQSQLSVSGVLPPDRLSPLSQSLHSRDLLDPFTGQHTTRLHQQNTETSQLATHSNTDLRLHQIIASANAPLTRNRYSREWQEFSTFVNENHNGQITSDSVIDYFVSLDRTNRAYLAIQIRAALENEALLNNIPQELFNNPFLTKLASGVVRRGDKPRSEPTDAFTFEMLERLINEVPSYRTKDRDIALILIGLYCLMRPGEIQSLTRESIKICHDGSINVTFTRLKQPPGTPITSIFIRARTYCGINPITYITSFINTLPLENTTIIFTGRSKSSPLTTTSISFMLQRLVEKIGIQAKISAKSLRIGGACFAAARGYGPAEIQALGGWKGTAFLRYIRDIPRIDN